MQCSGNKVDLSQGSSLGETIIDEGSRVDGNELGAIYNVTQIIEATSNIPEWSDAELPFATPRARQAMGQTFTDTQTPFKFSFSYPPNNYKLNDARVLIDTSRDSSDTEGIFVDGVFTGRVPGSFVGTSPFITHRHYVCVQQACNGAIAPTAPANTYYMTWSLTHYKQNTINTFDLDLDDLLTPTTVKPVDVVSDGVVRVVTGDDSPVYKALLILDGITISQNPLTCSNSNTYTFSNVYIHNDGNSISQPAFSGSVVAPNISWTNNQVGFRSVEFYFDPKLPKVSSSDFITLTSATIALRVKRQATGAAAIVVNGVGISQSGFDRTQATTAVERWIDDAATVTRWNNFVNAIPATNTDTTANLNLANLYGNSEIKELILQGNLNLSLAGSLGTAFGQAATSTRTFGVTVAGPELNLSGSFYTQVCQVPNNPSSPLNDSGEVPTGLDGASPIVSSIQVVNITQNSATIQWLTNEPATTQVGYGFGNTDTNSTLDSQLTTFHSVDITGLDPYKFYTYVVKSQDGSGNLTISGAKTFRTQR